MLTRRRRYLYAVVLFFVAFMNLFNAYIVSVHYGDVRWWLYFFAGFAFTFVVILASLILFGGWGDVYEEEVYL